MTRATIDFGIDLGTTNSAIAVLNGTQAEVIRNNENHEITPSAVWLDRKGRIVVGESARERAEQDSENLALEFKRVMGETTTVSFQRSGEEMTPPQLSAELLKSLKGDVQQRLGEELQAAVITVPASFDLPQNEATNVAAQLAGITTCVLLQEPVAAGQTWGFQTGAENVFWLVYDLGGGTFDAAVIQVRDGTIEVVNHAGDSHLGGKLIDDAIVDELLVPAVAREHGLRDFNRGNPQYKSAIAHLKSEAEKAKIALSRQASVDIEIDSLVLNRDEAAFKMVEFNFELARGDVERLMEPFIVRSINLCKRALEEKRLGPADVEKVLLVGGPTFTPYLRERLADPGEGLGIPVDFSADPMTAVARGAAIFAATQRLPDVTPDKVERGQYALELEYDPIGPDTETFIGGRAAATDAQDLSGFTIEFIDDQRQPPWRSGRIPLGADGSFTSSLSGVEGHRNEFRVELLDHAGTKCDTVPDMIPYTVGIAMEHAPLTHDIGVAMANNAVDVFFKKGDPLPAKKRRTHRTAVEVLKDQPGEKIRIPFVEGEHARANRNREIGALEIHSNQIGRDVPLGSEVQITAEMDESRRMLIRAFVAILDEEYEKPLTMESARPEATELRDEYDHEKARLQEVRGKALELGDPQATKALARIDQEAMEHEVEASLAGASLDLDAARTCQNRLLDLKAAIDEVEDALEWPALVAEAEEAIKELGRLFAELATKDTAEHKDTANRLMDETRQMMRSRDPDLLRAKVASLNELTHRILSELPEYWVGLFRALQGVRTDMTNLSQADQLFSQGERAIQSGDVPGLTSVCRQLIALVPREKQAEIPGVGTTIL